MKQDSDTHAGPDRARTPMRLWLLPGVFVLTLLGPIVAASAAPQQYAPHDVTVLEFGDAKTLFVADSEAGRIHAYEIPDSKPPGESRAFNVLGFSDQVAGLYSVDSDALAFHDIAVHPVSREAYVSLTVHKDGKALPAIVTASHQGEVASFVLQGLKSTQVELTDTPVDGVSFWRDIPATTFTVTDLDFANDTLYVSGLSNGEFASTLRKIAYPFKPDGTQLSRIEMYHTVHDQTETRAPIRALAVVPLGGEETIVAAYTCTPLVTVPTKALTAGARVKGKTVAELGYGNTPLDIVHFSETSMAGEAEDYILVVNRERSADLISVKDLEAANAREGLSKPEMWGHAGVRSRPLPLGAVMQVDDQDPQYLATLKRNLDTGLVDLVSFRKGAYFRLSNFVSEYNFPDYQYTEASQEGYRTFQNVLKSDEAFPELAREATSKEQ